MKLQIHLRKFLLLSVFFLITTNFQAQDKVVDSLYQLQLETKDDVKRVMLLNRISERLIVKNLDSSFYFLNIAKETAFRLKNDTLKLKVLFNYAHANMEKYQFKESQENYGDIETILEKLPNALKYKSRFHANRGVLFYYMNDLVKAKEDFSNYVAIAIEEKDEIKQSTGYNYLAAIGSREGKYEEALEMHFKSVNIAERLNNNGNMARSYNNIGLIYSDLKNYELAEKYHLKSLAIKTKFNDEIGLVGSYLNLGIVLRRMGTKENDSLKIIKAKDYYQKAFQLSEKMTYVRGLLNSLLNLALIENTLSNFKQGVVYGKKALDEALKARSKSHEISIRINLADSYRYDNQLIRAENQIMQALKLINEKDEANRDPYVLKECYLILSELYEQKNNYRKAYDYRLQYNEVNDSIFSKEIKKNADELQVKYETEKTEKELLQTQSDKALAELELSEQKQVTYGLIGGVLVLVLIGFSIVQRNKRKHQLVLSEQKEQNLQSIIIAEEKERTRIARELHDGIVQQIGATILKSRSTFKKLGVAEKPESEELLQELEASSSELRSISHQMMPRVLEEKGLIMALEELLENSLQSSEVKHSFEHTSLEERLPKNIEFTLYRITQELIQNIIKHSQASEVHLQLMKTNHQILYLVEDNGIGFQSKNEKGIGLKNIRSRIDVIKGSVSFDSENTGTLTTIKIPL